jgi:hypothetical protein
MSGTSQPAIHGGGAGRQDGLVSIASLIRSTEPPRGLDPSLHHTDTVANLTAAVEQLSSPGSKLPKVVSGPQKRHSTHMATTAPIGYADPEPVRADGASEIYAPGASPEFLAAAAAKFFTCTAEDLVNIIAPIVPNIAACRGLWASKFWAGSNILVMETPASFKATLISWRNASGRPSLSSKEIDTIVSIIANIIKIKPGNMQLAEPWIAVARDEFPGHDLAPFASLTEQETFQFVVDLCPPLARLREAWALNGLTGRELLAMEPGIFVEMLSHIHELAPGTAKLAVHQIPRVHEAVVTALKRYADHGDDVAVTVTLRHHEDFCRRNARKFGALEHPSTLNNADAQFSTPFNVQQSPVIVLSSDSSDCQVLSSGPRDSRKRDSSGSLADEAPPKRSLFPAKPTTGDISFMSQLGDTPIGSTLSYSAQKVGAMFIERGDGTIILQQQPAVIANFKQFDRYDAQGWATFIKQFRDENERVPISSRRTATSLTKHSVIEQIRDDFGITNWDDVTDDALMAMCFERFGPKTARDAKLKLEAETFYFNDATMHQSTFTSKLVSFFSRKLIQLADFVHAAKKWAEGETLSPWDLTDAIINMFPTDAKVLGPDGKSYVAKSSNNKTIVALIKKHRHETFKNLTVIIKKHFRAVDDRATQGQGVKYDIEPWSKNDTAEGEEKRSKQHRAGNSGSGRAQTARKNVQEIKTGGIKKAKKPGEKGARCCNCGKRGHRATKDDCLFWNHPQGRGADGVWEESEKSLRLSDDEFSAWCVKKKDFLDLKKANKDKAKANSKSAQCSCPAAHECHADEQSAGKAPATMSEQHRVAYISNMGATGVTTAFHAIGRFARNVSKRAPRTARVLMDPGADVNLIRANIVTGASKASTLKVLNTRHSPTDLFNNGVKIGHVETEYELQFTLDSPSGVATQHYTEWFMAWDDLEEEAILGADFNERQGFTNYQLRLVPHDTYVRKKQPTPCESAQDLSLAGLGHTRQWELDRRPSEAFMPGLETRGHRETCPHQQRILARMESESQLKRRHKTASAEAVAARSLHPWMCRPLKRPDKIMSPVTAERKNHARIDYNRFENGQLAAHLARSYCEKQHNLLKKLEPVGAAASHLTAEEHDVIVDAAKEAARQADDFFKVNAHLLGRKDKFMPTSRTARYFEEVPCEPEPKEGVQSDALPERKFPNRHVCVLQNLVNKAEMNGTAVRIINFDAEEQHYIVGIANPRGYWTCKEHYLRSLDPPPAAKVAGEATSALAPNLSFADCGIEKESGQPTLDPLERPVHRQYGKEYSAALTARIEAILKKYEHVFGKDISQACKFKPMKIELIPNKVLPASPTYWRNSPEQRKEVRNQLQSMLDMNIVSASDTAVVSNVLMVKRPGMPGKFRFTVDMRTLNDATVSMPWQMPDVQQQLDRLKGNRIFGCIDLSSYYHQIELDKGSRFLTGFITEDGVFEYNRVAMGLKNACAHAQSCLQKEIDNDPILRRYDVRNYFDDIPLAAKTEDEFCELLEAMLALGQRMHLKFNRDKSVFGVDSITHVGFVVRHEGVEVDAMRVDALRTITVPRSVKSVQSVLGAWNYIRNFIPNFSSRALPLTELVGSVKGANGKKKPKPFVWTDKCQAAFDDLKAATLDTKLLVNIDFTKEIFIRCDSSQFGAGAVLFQLNDQGQELPIAYASRKYTLAERNYCTFQQEAGAVVWALEKFACFFQGHPVTVQSDHKNLSWVKKSAMPQLTRWRLRLQDFDFRIEYLPGPLNVVADGLSRIGVDDKDMLISMADILPAHAAEQSLLSGARNIPHRALNQISAYRSSDKRARSNQKRKCTAETIWGENPDDTASDDDDAVCRTAHIHPIGARHAQTDDGDETDVNEASLQVDVDDGDNHQNIDAHGEADRANPHGENEGIPPIPALDADDVICSMHNDVVGHAGVLTTLQRVLRADKQWASRKQMIADIDAFLGGCVTCQKFRKRHNRAKDQRFHIEGSPFSELSVDVLYLPRRDCRDNAYVVVMVDSFSRWVTCVPVPDKSALSAARALVQTVGTFGVPLTIRSDGGSEFINATVEAFEALVGAKHHKLTPYLHEGNSLAEKANRAVLENLRNLIFDKRYDLNGEHQWSDLLPLAQRILNASFNSSIGCSPAQLVFGDNLELDRCLLTAMPAVVSEDTPEYIRQLTHNQRVMMDKATITLDATHALNLKKWKATHKSDTSLHQRLQENPDEGVWVLARVRDDAPLDKWKPRWAGPFRLLDFKSQTQSIVRLWDTVTNKVLEAHLNDVELWDHRFTESVEGLTKVAEYDGWQYPMDGITAMALTPADPDGEFVMLDTSVPRTKNKNAYSFYVKWRNYEEQSWVKYNGLKDTSTFQVWAAAHPVLKF